MTENPDDTSSTKNRLLQIPQELRDLKQWVVWKLEMVVDKVTKIPYRADIPSYKASSTNKNSWSSFNQAVFTLENEKNISGVGFVFSEEDPYIGIDFDKCIEAATGIVFPSVEVDIAALGSYTEISQSNLGVHVIGRGENPDPERKGCKRGNIEMYSRGRYFAITGNLCPSFNHEIKDIPDDVIRELYLKHFITGPVATKPKTLAEFRGRGNLYLADDDIISLCEHAKNGYKFNSLWRGSTMGYPSQSEAEMALCCIFAFYTKDISQLQRLLRTSGMYRKKLDRVDYIDMVIKKSIGVVNESYNPKAQMRSRWVNRRRSLEGGGTVG